MSDTTSRWGLVNVVGIIALLFFAAYGGNKIWDAVNGPPSVAEAQQMIDETSTLDELADLDIDLQNEYDDPEDHWDGVPHEVVTAVETRRHDLWVATVDTIADPFTLAAIINKFREVKERDQRRYSDDDLEETATVQWLISEELRKEMMDRFTSTALIALQGDINSEEVFRLQEISEKFEVEKVRLAADARFPVVVAFEMNRLESLTDKNEVRKIYAEAAPGSDTERAALERWQELTAEQTGS